MMRKQLILASASPRRKELMQDSGLPFQIIPSKKEEIVPLHLPAAQAIEQLALVISLRNIQVQLSLAVIRWSYGKRKD